MKGALKAQDVREQRKSVVREVGKNQLKNFAVLTASHLLDSEK